jgi:hypothetical protein
MVHCPAVKPRTGVINRQKCERLRRRERFGSSDDTRDPKGGDAQQDER